MVAGMVVFAYISGGFGFIGAILGGALAGTFGSINFVQSLIPTTKFTLSVIRVGIGIEPNDDPAFYMGGDVPGVATWDEVGTGLGWSQGFGLPVFRDPPKVKAGNYRDIQVRHNGRNNGSPTYLAVSANGNDAICVSFIAVTEPSGLSRGWFGDIGAHCGGNWFYSAQIVGEGNYRPKCVWLAKSPNTIGTEARALGIHLPDFSGNQPGLSDQYTKDDRTMCGSQPRFSFYSDFEPGVHHLPVFKPTLRYKSDGADVDISRLWTNGTLNGHQGGIPIPWEPIGRPRHGRPIPPGLESPIRPAMMKPHRAPGIKRRNFSSNQTDAGPYKDTIVVTDYPLHQTEELCNSPASRGPSLVNTKEGFFCDMNSRKRYPVCGGRTVCACLDLGSHSTSGASDTKMRNGTTPFMRTCKKSYARDTSSNAVVPHRSFGKVLDWT
ncbi:MAG: hypothetical protein Q9165_004861 [Trypethelium subeluteriae]